MTSAVNGVIPDLEVISTRAENFKFGADPVRHVQIAGAVPFLPPRALDVTASEFVWDWLKTWHEADALPPPRAVNCYLLQDMRLLGHDTVALNGHLAIGNEVIPQYRSHQIQTSHALHVAQQLSLPVKVIEEPCFALAADGHVYGHFLIESLPRLHLVRRHLHRSLPPYRILISATAPAWLLRIVRDVYGFNEDEIIFHDPEKESVLLRQAIWPSLMTFGDYLHPINNFIFNELALEFGSSRSQPTKALFITRSFFTNPNMLHRPFLNEIELAGIAATEFDLSPIAPETLPWRDQIDLFAGAKLVVGSFGSGLHNTVFSGAGTQVGVLRFSNLLQSNIATLRNHRISYLTENNDLMPYHVNCDLFRRFLGSIRRG